MDKNQKSCILFAIDARPIELYVPEVTEGPKFHIWRLVTSGPFENFILSLIIGNTLLLMLKVRRPCTNDVNRKGGGRGSLKF